MQQEIDLMQHLLQASQHAVTREEMTAQFRNAEQQNKERFEQVEKQLERQSQALMGMGQNIKGVRQEIKHQMRWSLGILVSIGGLVLGILKNLPAYNPSYVRAIPRGCSYIHKIPTKITYKTTIRNFCTFV